MIVERYMQEDIIEGYRLSKVPHKRPEIYSFSIESFLKKFFCMEQIEFCQEFQRKIDRKHSFKKKSSSVSNSEPHNSPVVPGPKRNSITSGIIISNKENKLKDDLMRESLQERSANKLSISLNETSLRSALAIPSLPSTKPNPTAQKLFFKKSNVQLPLTKNSSPLSPFALNTSNYEDDFKNSSDISSINCSSETNVKSLNTKSIGPEILNRKSDKIVIKGYLNKYSKSKLKTDQNIELKLFNV